MHYEQRLLAQPVTAPAACKHCRLLLLLLQLTQHNTITISSERLCAQLQRAKVQFS